MTDQPELRAAMAGLRADLEYYAGRALTPVHGADLRLVLDALEERMAPLPRETAICFHQADGNSTAIPTCRHCGAPMTEGAGSTYIPPPPSRDLGSSAFDPHILEKP